MALIFANKSNLRPIGVGLYQTVTSMMNSGDWAGMFASVVIVFVPTVVIYAFLSDKIFLASPLAATKANYFEERRFQTNGTSFYWHWRCILSSVGQ